jgi:hypothetical protein
VYVSAQQMKFFPMEFVSLSETVKMDFSLTSLKTDVCKSFVKLDLFGTEPLVYPVRKTNAQKALIGMESIVVVTRIHALQAQNGMEPHVSLMIADVKLDLIGPDQVAQLFPLNAQLKWFGNRPKVDVYLPVTPVQMELITMDTHASLILDARTI